jgi:hypothetical protein
MHPVVHDWTYRRLALKERHRYMCWLVEELQSTMDTIYPIEGTWWGYLNHRLDNPIHLIDGLCVLRKAKMLSDLALSPTMVSYRSSRSFHS